jgi:predicted AAA+ superfamily ATPase
MWVNREIERRLLVAAAHRPAVVVTGARQTGKTSLIKKLFPDYSYVSLDLPSEAERAEKASLSFLEQYKPPLIIDEIQYAPALLRFLKQSIDLNRERAGQYILTGSQRFSLMKEVSDSLAGRAELIELEPLSVSEILAAAVKDLSHTEIMLRGGYPELYNKPELDHLAFYRSYIATYLERDVRQILNVADLRDFERFLRAAALRSGQLLNKAELARDVGIHPTTANDWISVLEASNQLILLEPWFSNRTKSIVKTPKLFLADTGILCSLLNIRTVQDLLDYPNRGAIWETYVFSELRKLQTASFGAWSLNFWRDKSNEVDFLSDSGGGFDLYEAKWTELPDMSDLKGFSAFRNRIKGKIKTQRLVCQTPNDYPLGQDILAVNPGSKNILRGSY